MVEIKRKLYRRGSSFETTIPMPMLFSLDTGKKHNVIFRFEKDSNRWYVEFEENKEEHGTEGKRGKGKRGKR